MGCDDYYLDEMARAKARGEAELPKDTSTDLHPDYIAQKIQDRGYPGINTADIAAGGCGKPLGMEQREWLPGDPTGYETNWPYKWKVCSYCGNQFHIDVPHDCYEKRNNVIGQFSVVVKAPPHQQAERILVHVLPRVINMWLEKTADYGDSTSGELALGPRAEFVRIWNKVAKLRRGLWEGKPLAGEQCDEIVSDLIGHLLLILDEMWGSPNRADGVD